MKMEWNLINFVSFINVKKLYTNGPNGPGRAIFLNGPGRAGPGRAGPGRAGPGRAGPGRKKSARAHLYLKSRVLIAPSPANLQISFGIYWIKVLVTFSCEGN